MKGRRRAKAVRRRKGREGERGEGLGSGMMKWNVLVTNTN